MPLLNVVCSSLMTHSSHICDMSGVYPDLRVPTTNGPHLQKYLEVSKIPL